MSSGGGIKRSRRRDNVETLFLLPKATDTSLMGSPAPRLTEIEGTNKVCLLSEERKTSCLSCYVVDGERDNAFTKMRPHRADDWRLSLW